MLLLLLLKVYFLDFPIRLVLSKSYMGKELREDLLITVLRFVFSHRNDLFMLPMVKNHDLTLLR